MLRGLYSGAAGVTPHYTDGLSVDNAHCVRSCLVSTLP